MMKDLYVYTESELLRDLEAPVISFRMFALEHIIGKGASEKVRRILNKRKSIEDDEECLALLLYAVASFDRRDNEENTIFDSLPDPAVFCRMYEASSKIRRLQLLSALPADSLQKYSDGAALLLRQESNTMVQAALIRTFARTWPIEHAETLNSLLASKSLNVRIAALDALVRIAPQALENELPNLLISKDPRIRGLAIRGLSQIDMDEAIAHLDWLFSTTETYHQLAALRCCFFFPFDRVKGIVLKHIAVESDLAILEKAGLLLSNNPDIDVPPRIWEIAAGSPPGKAEVLKKILARSISGIEKSGILGIRLDEYRDKLQKWIYKRSARRYVQDVVLRLYDPGSDCDIEFQTTLFRSMHELPVYQTFVEALEWEIAPEVKNKLRIVVNNFHTQPISQAFGAEEESFENLTDEEKIRKLASWGVTLAPEHRKRLEMIIGNPRSASDLRAAAFRVAQRLGGKFFSDSAEKFLADPNPNLASAAMEYLGRIDPERLLPLLGKYFQSASPRLTMTALRIFKRFDPSQAVSIADNMLFGEREEYKESALAAMVHFHFSLIRDLVFSFLKSRPSQRLFDIGLILFQANPDPDNLYPLYKLVQSAPTVQVERVQLAAQRNMQALLDLGLRTKPELDKLSEEFKKRFEDEKLKILEQPPDYSIAKLRSLPETRQVSKVIIMVRSIMTHFKIALIVTFTAIVCLGIWMMFDTGGSHFPQKAELLEPPPVKMSVSGVPADMLGGSDTAILEAGEPEKIAQEGKTSPEHQMEIPPNIMDQKHSGYFLTGSKHKSVTGGPTNDDYQKALDSFNKNFPEADLNSYAAKDKNKDEMCEDMLEVLVQYGYLTLLGELKSPPSPPSLNAFVIAVKYYEKDTNKHVGIKSGSEASVAWKILLKNYDTWMILVNTGYLTKDGKFGPKVRYR